MGIFKLPKWLPAIRSHILEMARVWLVILALKIGLWNIPNTVFAELNDRFVEADTALKEARASPRGEVLNTRVRVAFEKPAACMRDITDRCFKTPPLLDEDFVALLLKPPKKKYSPMGKPRAQAAAGPLPFGAHLLSVTNIKTVNGPSAGPRADFWTYISTGSPAPHVAAPLPAFGTAPKRRGAFVLRSNQKG